MAGRLKSLLLLLGPLLATLLWRPRCLSGPGPDFRPLTWPARKALALKNVYRRLKMPIPDARGASSGLEVDDVDQLDPDFFDDDDDDDDDDEDYYTDSDFSTAGQGDLYSGDQGKEEVPRYIHARPQRERAPKMPGRFLGGESAEYVEEMKTPGRMTGVVSRWLNEKGIGWIELDEDRATTVFAHYSKIAMDARNRPDQSSLRLGDHVEFDIGPDPKGPIALDITGIGRSKVQPGYAPYTKVDWRPKEAPRRVIVGNLKYHVTINDLKTHFGQVGPVKFVDIKRRVLENGDVVCNGCAMVRFLNAKDARQAINMFHNQMFQGRNIMVQVHLEHTEQWAVSPNAEHEDSLLPWT